MERKLWVRAFAIFYIVNAVFHIVTVVRLEAVMRGQSWILGTGMTMVLGVNGAVMLYREAKQKELQEQYHLR